MANTRVIVIAIIAIYCIGFATAFISQRTSLSVKRSPSSNSRTTSTLTMSLQEQLFRTTALISDEAAAAVTNVGGEERNWLMKLVNMIPSPSMGDAPIGEGVDYIGGTIGVELIVVGVLTILLAAATVAEKILETRLEEKYRTADLDWSVKNDGVKSALRELAEEAEYWPEDDLRYRRDLRRRLGRDPSAEAAFATDDDGDSNVNGNRPKPKPQQQAQNNQSGLNRKMRRMEKYAKKK